MKTRTFRRGSLILVLLFALAILGGCTAKSDELVVGMELQYPPFETTDASGNPSGISVDIANELGSMTFATIVLLGCLSQATRCFKRESFEAALRDVLPARHHDKIPGNLAAFDRGAFFAN